MRDDFGNILSDQDWVVRHNANNGWAVDDCEVPLVVIKAPEDSNRKFDLFNPRTKKTEHFVKRREWQDMGASGCVLYTYEYITAEEAKDWDLIHKTQQAKKKLLQLLQDD